MAIQHLSPGELREAVAELDRGLYNHEQWLDALFGTLICRLQPDARDLDGNAHRSCRLGQWYHAESTAGLELANRPGFAELGSEHERMHHYAGNMLRASQAGESISLDDYQRFISSLKRMRMEIFTLKQDIEETLHALDPLTGIPGRIGVLTNLREQQALVKRKVQTCCIAMMDIDNFKTVNDSFGHAAGDNVLVAFAHLMLQGLRPYDKVYRFGGEEFLIVLPGTTPENALGIIERLRTEMESMSHGAEARRQFRVTASFGLSCLDPGILVEECIERADQALYQAKADGRNCCAIWHAKPTGDDAAASKNSAA